MSPAIIRLSKKTVLSSETQHSDLVQLRSWVNENIEDLKARSSSICSGWDDLHERHRLNLMQSANNFGESTRQRLKS
jgi:hypothetical protein